MEERARQALLEMGFGEEVAARAARECSGEEDAVRRALTMTGQDEEKAELGEMKMVFVVREELGLSSAQVAESVAHAVVDCALDCHRLYPAQLAHYLAGGTPKIVLRCTGDKALVSLFLRARRAGIPARLVSLPLAEGKQPAVLGVGPADKAQIDAVTGALRLL